MKKIKKINEKNEVTIYNSIQDASKSIETKLEDWKVQLFIVDAINKNKRAFKCKWEQCL